MESESQSQSSKSEPLSTTKTIAICAIVVVCFAVVYPRFFHPMFSKMMGSSAKQDGETEQDIVPPHMPPKPEAQSGSRPGPHPGMRGAAEAKAQQQAGPGRGMMGVVLPMYAVGIVVYLIYTLVKVFSKSKDEKSPVLGKCSKNLKPKYSYKDGKFQYRDDISDNEAYRDYMRRKLMDRENQPDERSLEDREMTELQKRLMETECQMSRILEAMKNISNRVDTVAADDTVAGDGEVVGDDDEVVGDDDEVAGDTTDNHIAAHEQVENLGSLSHDHQKVVEPDQCSRPESVQTHDKTSTSNSLVSSPSSTDELADNLIAMAADSAPAGSETESDEDGGRRGGVGEAESETDSEDYDGNVMEELKACKQRMMEIEERMLVEGKVRRRKKIDLSE